ncbi:MAG: T9SS type A sorting domain-containing protein, partial [Candidatus Kapaibacterium sp.]
SFTVESDYNSKLFLYDSYGNLVKILFENQEFQNDENLLSFSISDFNSGIYYLALYSGANSSIKKLVFYK